MAPIKTSLAHLPELQQQELAKVADIICAATDDVRAVLLYGSFARGDWVDGPHEQGHGKLVGHKLSDYDILVVTSSEYTAMDDDLWAAVRSKLSGVSRSTICPIARDLNFINDKLMEGQYFFTEIINDAIALYINPDFTLEFEEPTPLDPKREVEIAERVMGEVFEDAKDFYDSFELAFERGKYKHAAFLLNQACEPAFKTVLQIFGGEFPQEHYLNKLSPMAQHYCPELTGILFKDEHVPEPLFKLLDYAYIGARYDKNYKITAEELQVLAPRVAYLHEVVERVCKVKVQELKQKIK